uniref:Oxidation resistance protein 1 n=1 Tax=Polytomella parva TaxID=51329 RepID=A0A7S0YI88_9CHLO|mmetsp:Transcript_30961/g.56305  ORF Transcript_30961/g.56305 Transcript_30961/m.56305 type:complete len:605 (+) Transcript_30961:93-1907(+)
METSDTPLVSSTLEDTQASLATALARIEVFRIREKQLVADLASLRRKVHELSKYKSSIEEESSAGEYNVPEIPPAKVESDWTSISSQPVYVTNIPNGDVPINIVTGLKKVPGSIVVTPEYIDFVEIKARIRQEDFVGISSLKAKTLESPLHDLAPSFTGIWQVIWNKGGINQRLSFEASHSTRNILHQRMEHWLGESNADTATEPLVSETTDSHHNLYPSAFNPSNLHPSDPMFSCCFPWGLPPADGGVKQPSSDASASPSTNPPTKSANSSSPLPTSTSGTKIAMISLNATTTAVSPVNANDNINGNDNNNNNENSNKSNNLNVANGCNNPESQILLSGSNAVSSSSSSPIAPVLPSASSPDDPDHHSRPDHPNRVDESNHNTNNSNSKGKGASIQDISLQEREEDLSSHTPLFEATPPIHLAPLPGITLTLDGSMSQLLRDKHVSAIASHIPPLQRMRRWTCTYSTFRHGTSLQTLYRKSVVHQPALLVIQDFSGFLLGAYTSEGWRVAPRFYGSGETFVFQLEPTSIAYPWQSRAKDKNDYFMYGTLDCLALGGQGRFAIWLDNDLARGSSGRCGTFDSPCLAAAEEFGVKGLEIWQPTGH